MSMETAEMWVRFMAANMADSMSVEEAAEFADKAMDQFHKRYEWYSGGYGPILATEAEPENEEGRG